jgi:predicted PhzF superfamily epimerase YddE/YHI9
LVILDNESDIEELQPDFALLKKIPFRGIIVSAPSSEFDFVSRCFFPSTGVDEDPVTGSAHTTLTPYWSKRLDKKKLSAKQVSQRGGLLSCEDADDRVLIGGKAVLYMIGSINLT